MIITDLIDNLIIDLKADKAISLFCQTHYSKSPLFQIGLDPELPPAESDYPIIVFSFGKYDMGKNLLHAELSLDISVGIKSDTIDIGTSQTKAYMGFKEVIDLSELIILTCDNSGYGKITNSGQSEIFSYYPFFIMLNTFVFNIVRNKKTYR